MFYYNLTLILNESFIRCVTKVKWLHFYCDCLAEEFEYMKAKQNKYIDLNQFIYNKQGKISWEDCIGLTVEFFYNGKRHEIKILERINKDYFKIMLDDIVIEKAHTTKITGLMFDNLLYEPDYFYNVGDIINEKIEIIKQFQIQRKATKGKCKGYLCRCLVDGYEFAIEEFDLKNCHGCPVCVNRVIVKGVNDIGTTDPELVPLFVDENDAYCHSRSSGEKVFVKCPYCGTIKKMIISELTKCGYVTCDICSDGISYPNKFAHELFRQLSAQYIDYQSEYSPDWAGQLRYDNYVELLNNKRIIVEMDGGFHRIKRVDWRTKNDSYKDELAEEHNIQMIRVDCNYLKVGQRYNIVKTNLFKALDGIFNLSNVDWDKCNEMGISNKLIEVLEYYTNNPKLGLSEIARDCKISMPTLYEYLYIGEELGLCAYIRNDTNRTKNSKPIAMYDLQTNLIGVYKSGKQISELFPELNFNHRQIRKCATNNKPYKNYIFKFATYEEYQRAC